MEDDHSAVARQLGLGAEREGEGIKFAVWRHEKSVTELKRAKYLTDAEGRRFSRVRCRECGALN